MPGTAATPLSPRAALPRRRLKIRLFARTDVGQVREHNEDNFLVRRPSPKRERGLVRGQSLHHPRSATAPSSPCATAWAAPRPGEVASQLAVDILLERMTDGLDDRADRRATRSRAGWCAPSSRPASASSRRPRSIAAVAAWAPTVTASALVDNHLFLAQVGDSRGYILRGDHAGAGDPRSIAGEPAHRSRSAHRRRSRDLRAQQHHPAGARHQPTPSPSTLTFVELRRLATSSSSAPTGLSGMVRFDDIREILKSSTEPLEICKAMTERANQAGGHDNITVIVAQFDGDGRVHAQARSPRRTPSRSATASTTCRKRSSELTEPGRRSHRDILAAARAARSAGDPDSDGDGDERWSQRSAARVRGSRCRPTARLPALAASPSDAWHERGPQLELRRAHRHPRHARPWLGGDRAGRRRHHAPRRRRLPSPALAARRPGLQGGRGVLRDLVLFGSSSSASFVAARAPWRSPRAIRATAIQLHAAAQRFRSGVLAVSGASTASARTKSRRRQELPPHQQDQLGAIRRSACGPWRSSRPPRSRARGASSSR